jgi:hypothetical protein
MPKGRTVSHRLGEADAEAVGFDAKLGISAGGGLATLRRDGFASMDAELRRILSI